MSTPTKIKVASWFKDDLEALQSDPAFVAEGVILDVTEQIYAVMDEEGISQQELAERLDVSKSAVSQMLSGDQNISIKRLVKVALALGMTLEAPKLAPFQRPRIEPVYAGHHSASVTVETADTPATDDPRKTLSRGDGFRRPTHAAVSISVGGAHPKEARPEEAVQADSYAEEVALAT